jgi:hypothetical protein
MAERATAVLSSAEQRFLGNSSRAMESARAVVERIL